MALEDLIIDQKQISKELLEKLLVGKAELIKEDQGVNLTKVGNDYSNKTRILLYLCGKKAWEFLSSKVTRASIEELEKNLGIKGNTLRPILKELKDSYQVDAEKGKYKILPKGVFELEKNIEYENKKEKEGGLKTPKESKSTKQVSKSEFIEKLYNEEFFKEPKKMSDVMNELKKLGVSIKITSLPSYLLPLVRKRKLIRDQIIEGKRKIWVYKSSESKK